MVKRIGTIGGRTQPVQQQRSITKDGLVLGAIALVCVAFGVGLYDQMGINVVLATTLAAAGFFVLFSLHYIIVQLSSSESMAPRISSLERVVARLARDMSQVEDMSKEIAEFRRTCERIDQAHSQLELGGFGESIQMREETVQRLQQDVKRLDGQIRSLRNYFDLNNQENKERMKSELRAIESHVKTVSDNLRLQAPDRHKDFSLGIPPGLPNTPPAETNFESLSLFDSQQGRPLNSDMPAVTNLPNNIAPAPAFSPQTAQSSSDSTEFEFKPLPEPVPQQSFFQQQEVQFTPQPLPGFGTSGQNDTSGSFLPTPQEASPPVNAGPFFREESKPSETTNMLETIRKAISTNRMDLYLQPIVYLSERNVAFYEALTRLKDEEEQLIYPAQFLDIARRGGVMPVIDNVMLFRSVQVIRKLLERDTARGLFCNLSSSSLMDHEFFPEFLNFMEKNKDLAGNLFFDIDQDFYDKASRQDIEKLTSLAKLGYRLSLDKVTRLDIDYGQLQRQGFRFLKVDSHILLNGMEQAGARIHVADMQTYLKRYSIDLIAGKIETESVLTQLLSYNLQLGQGFLFSEPRPVRPEIFKKGSSQQAA